MPEFGLFAAVDLASPRDLVVILVNLLAGLVAGWWFAARGFIHEFADVPTSLNEVRELAGTLSGRVDRHLLRMQVLRRDLTRLELTNGRELSRIVRSLHEAIQRLEGELKGAACRLRRDAQRRRLTLSRFRQTTTLLADSLHARRAVVESLSDEFCSHVTDEESRGVEIVRALQHLVRSLDRFVASARHDFTIVMNQGHLDEIPDANGRARPPTEMLIPSSSADARHSSHAGDGNRSADQASDSDAQRIRTLTEKAAAQQQRAERENRSDRRWNLALPAVAVPLDDLHQPVGEPARMVTRDISTGGISLLHTQPVPARFLRVQLDTPILQSTDLIVHVLRTRTIGAYTEIAGEFVARIDANQQKPLSDLQSVRKVEP